MTYKIMTHYRKAQEKESVLIYNTATNSCIRLDPLSFLVFQYMEKHSPSTDDMLSFSQRNGIFTSELQRLLQCLKECGFVYEN